MKYGWAGSGMVMIAIPILTSKAESDRAGESGVGHTDQKGNVKIKDRQRCQTRLWKIYSAVSLPNGR